MATYASKNLQFSYDDYYCEFCNLTLFTLTGDSREKEAQRVAQRVTTRTVDEVEYYYRESAQLAQDLVANQDRIQGVY